VLGLAVRGEDKNASAASAMVTAPPQSSPTSPDAGLSLGPSSLRGWNPPSGVADFQDAADAVPVVGVPLAGQVFAEDDRDRQPPCHAASGVSGWMYRITCGSRAASMNMDRLSNRA
jgi:hypothetical protein